MRCQRKQASTRTTGEFRRQSQGLRSIRDRKFDITQLVNVRNGSNKNKNATAVIAVALEFLGGAVALQRLPIKASADGFLF